MHSTTEATVQLCPSDRRPAALRLLFSNLSPSARIDQADRLAESVTDRDDPFAGLFWAVRDNEPVAACWAQLQPGRSGMLWPPQVTDEADEAVAGRLLAMATEFFARSRPSIAQALLDQSHGPVAESLISAGYRHLTDLEYLVCMMRPRAEANSQQRLEYELYSHANHQRFCEILKRTYQGSLDCPEMDGLRCIEDVVEGYRKTGVFHPSRWMLLRSDGVDMGVMILADHPQNDQWELVYLGLTPEARGRGFGREATAFAARLALGARRRQMVLAVDSRNRPARALYEHVGFIEWDRRCVFLRSFDR